MRRRDLLRTLGAAGAVTAVGRALEPPAAARQSFPAITSRSAADGLASRLSASIQKHNVPGASADAGGVASVVFGNSFHDSVDADDGVPNNRPPVRRVLVEERCRCSSGSASCSIPAQSET